MSDRPIASIIAQYKQIIADLELHQSTNPNARIKMFIAYESGEIIPMLLENNNIVTTNDSDDDYYNKSTYLNDEIDEIPYDTGSLIFVPVDNFQNSNQNNNQEK
ncbi:MAG: hypothetical protein E6R13_01935 [Spirochaetes bacterium]|nr:MAG: hypothetical protein E6R13_01935 [Spirochaetota bacterium]